MAEQSEAVSILSWPQVCSQFDLRRVRHCMDEQDIIRYVPTHALSLGVSCTIKSCSINIMRDSTRIYCALAMEKRYLVTFLPRNSESLSC